MFKNILVILLLLFATAGSSRAKLSEPDVIFQGTATLATPGSSISLRLVGAVTPLASVILGQDLTYTLRIPMDAYEPRATGTAISGDAAEILNNAQVLRSLTIPPRGSVVRLDLDPSRTAEQWAKDHPGDDGSGDLNRNGISDLQEYLAGGDPAGCVWLQVDASHAETTVYHPNVLTSCLVDAGEDGMHNLIRLVSGSYTGSFGYTAGWKENFDLTLIGGYDANGSGVRVINPALTILNGDSDNDGSGNGTILTIDTDLNKTAGIVRVEGLTFIYGKAATGQSGGAIQARVYQGDLELVGNIFTVNRADSGGAISAESRDSAMLFLTNNLLYANSADNAAAVLIYATAGGPVVLLNNTIVENAATVNGDGRSLLLKTTYAAGIDVTGTIITGIDSVTGKDVYISNSDSSSPVIRNNSLDTADLLVNSTGFVPDPGNALCNPQFVSPATGNYQLGATSSCIDKGFTHAKLTEKDIAGAQRKSGKKVDLGAYEYQQPNPTLVMTISGRGSVQGTVSPSGQTYSCENTVCTPLTFIAGDQITLTAVGSGSDFSAWSGACLGSTNPCVLDLVGDMTVGVSFMAISAKAIVEGSQSSYSTLVSALDAPTQNATVRARDMDFSENITHTNLHDITLRGGFSDQAFADNSQSGYSMVSGSLRIQAGRLTVERVKVRP